MTPKHSVKVILEYSRWSMYFDLGVRYETTYAKKLSGNTNRERRTLARKGSSNGVFTLGTTGLQQQQQQQLRAEELHSDSYKVL